MTPTYQALADKSIKAVTYAPKSAHGGKLVIEYRNGAVDKYNDVPPQVHRALISAPDVAQYIESHISGHYDGGQTIAPESEYMPAARTLLAAAYPGVHFSDEDLRTWNDGRTVDLECVVSYARNWLNRRRHARRALAAASLSPVARWAYSNHVQGYCHRAASVGTAVLFR